MKKLFFLFFCFHLIGIASASVSSSVSEDPSLFCHKNPNCTDKMNKISQNFKKGNVLFAKENLIGFSGACFHLSYLYDSLHEHHGAFVFEKNQNDLMADGIFLFFYPSDPFNNMTSQELKDWFIESKSTMVKTNVKASVVELQFLGEGSDYHYWMRSDKSNSKLFVIGKQASNNYDGLLFCELNRR